MTGLSIELDTIHCQYLVTLESISDGGNGSLVQRCSGVCKLFNRISPIPELRAAFIRWDSLFGSRIADSGDGWHLKLKDTILPHKRNYL